MHEPPALDADGVATPDPRALAARCAALEAENALLKRADAMHNELMEMVLEGRGLTSIVERLSALCGNPVAVDDYLYHVIASSHPDEPSDRHWREAVARGVSSREFLDDIAVAAYVRRAGQDKRPVLIPTFPVYGFDRRRLTAPILAGDDLLGYVTLLEARQPFQDVHETVLRRAALILALELMKQRVALETELRLTADFLRDLFSGSYASREAIVNRGGFLGIDLRRPWTLLVLDADDEDALRRACQVDDPALARLRLFEIVRRAVRSCSPGSLAVMHSECMVILTPAGPAPEAPAGGPRALAEVLRREIQWAYPSVTASVAIGGRCVELGDFGRRHAEARRALDALGSLNTRNQTVTLDDLGIYGILFRREDQAELLGFARRVLGPLLEYDRRQRSNLLGTLQVYLEENGAFRASARRLSVHLNTLRGRLERISQLCAVDLRDARTRLNFQVALEIHRLGQPDRPAPPTRDGNGSRGAIGAAGEALPLPQRGNGKG